nr:hypothetical protein [uncultured Butyrivibrio sp.]
MATHSNQISPHASKQIRNIIIGVVIAAIIIAVGKYAYDYVSGLRYKEKVELCAYHMYDGAADAEDTCNTICSVWYNSIWQEEDSETDKYTKDSNGFFYDDFNDALDKLYEDETFLETLRGINSNLEKTNEYMRDLQNPPKGCEQLHKAFMDFYNEYYTLVNLALDPSGNYNSYSSDFSDADKKSADNYDKLMVFLE